MMTLVLAFMGVARAQSPSSYTFDFENGTFQGWTTIDANHDGYDWMNTSSLLNAWGINLFGGYGHDDSQYFLASQSRDFWHLFFGLEHDNYLVSPRVNLGGSISFWATSRADLILSEEHFGVAVSTTNNYDPNAFTMVQEWTISGGEPIAHKTGREIRSIYFGTWYEYTVDLSAFSGEGYVAIRHFGNGQWMLVVDDITIDLAEPVVPVEPEEPVYVPGLHTLAYYGVGDYNRELIDLLYIERPNGAWMEPYHFNLYNDGEYDVEVVLIDFLHNNGYFTMLDDGLYNFTVENNGRPGVDLYLTTNVNWTSTNVINSMLAVNTTEGPRSTHLFDIIAVPYQPYCPDVVEKAYNIGTVTTGTTWSMYASEMWNEVNPEAEYNLHDNYTLPFPEIPEGYDAVMKFTADHDIMLNAYVSDGANGKVALYREDFAGRPGPMADNNYTMRPFNPNGGGAPVAQTAIDFEAGNFSQFSNYTNDATYPWFITADAAYTGSYGMKSGNAGVASSASTFTTTVNYTNDGTISFDYAAWGEGTYVAWDKCVFQIDGEEMFREGASQVWESFSAEVAAGEHTFSWIYEKDGSLDPTGDYFAVDNIVFEGGRIAGNRDIATSFEGSLGGWTTIDADGDGFNWDLASVIQAGFIPPAYSGEDCMTSESYSNDYAMALTPDNYLVSPQIELGGSITFYACAQDASWAAEHFGVAVSTTNNTNASAFTTIQEWTMTAKGTGAKMSSATTRSGNRAMGTWYQFTVDLSAYAGQAIYVALRHFDCSDWFYLDVDDFFIGVPVEDGEWIEATANESTLTITGLTPETEYEWQVQGINPNCEGGVTEWSEMATFFNPMPFQTIELTAGANWVSFNVEITLNELKAALVEALPGANNIMIKSRTQNTKYNGTRWTGSLTWDLSQMYTIIVGSDCVIVMNGTPVDPSAHPATIKPGTNWIAYPLTETMTLTDAFAGFAIQGDKVKGRNGNSQYNRGRWQGTTLTTLEPGKGYYYISPASENRILVFPTPAK